MGVAHTARMLAQCIQYLAEILLALSIVVVKERFIWKSPRYIELNLAFITRVSWILLHSLIQVQTSFVVNNIISLLLD